MYKVTVEVPFDAAHRLMNYSGKCKILHGHTFTAIVCVGCENLNEAGFVIDFSILKKFVKEWINSNWDHTTILNRDDILVPLLLGIDQNEFGKVYLLGMCVGSVEAQRLFLMEGDPTAERMAKYLFDVVGAFLPGETLKVKVNPTGHTLELVTEGVEDPVVVKYVLIKETPMSIAIYRPEGS